MSHGTVEEFDGGIHVDRNCHTWNLPEERIFYIR